MYIKIAPFVMIVISGLCACQPLSPVVETAAPPSPIIVEDTQAPPTATAIPPTATELPTLSETQIKNMTVYAPVYQREITLTDGSFTIEGELWVNLLPNIAFGDLNGDGWEDSAVLLAENGGGTGTFVSLLVLLNDNGQPRQADALLVDDRPLITSLEIISGKISLVAVIHTVSDPACCPSLEVDQTYVLDSDRLVLIRQTSLASTGAVRAIYIENPPSGSQSALPVHIQGNMPIAPFENNLVYRVYDLSFNELDAGPFSVTSADYGGPATFDNAIHSPAFIPGATVWFELRDASAADGTPLAIERIKLVIQ